MRQLRSVLIALCCWLCITEATAQDSIPVQFTYSKKRIDADSVALSITVQVRPGIRLYAVKQPSAESIASVIEFDSTATKFVGSPLQETAFLHKEKDESVQTESNYFTDSATWKQVVAIKAADSVILKGTINYLYKQGDEYKPGEEKFKFFIRPEIKTASSESTSVENKSLLWIFFAAFGGGLLALLTPCVYSMIPVTVSFFTKRSKTKAQGIRNALIYASSIVVIFTLLGFLVTLIFGPAALNNLQRTGSPILYFSHFFFCLGFLFLVHSK